MLDVACWKLKGKSLLGVAYPRRASWARKRPVPSALGKSNLFWTCSSCTPAKNSRKTAETHRNTKSSLDFRPKNCQQANKHAPKSVRDDLKGKHHKYQKQQVINLYKLLTSDPSCILLAYFLHTSWNCHVFGNLPSRCFPRAPPLRGLRIASSLLRLPGGELVVRLRRGTTRNGLNLFFLFFFNSDSSLNFDSSASASFSKLQ